MIRAALVVSIMLIVSAVLTAAWTTPATAQETPPAERVEKTVCASAIGYTTLEQLKLDLETQAKRAAANELFGELIAAATTVDNLMVTADQIRVQSLGLIRLEGDVRYTNGPNLAEVCATLTAYVTAQDRAQFVAETITGRQCVTDAALPVRELRASAEAGAQVKALVEYDPRLMNYDAPAIQPLLRRIDYTESDLLPGTDTYCATVVGEVIPIEMISFFNLSDDLLLTDSSTSTPATTNTPLPSEYTVLPAHATTMVSANPTHTFMPTPGSTPTSVQVRETLPTTPIKTPVATLLPIIPSDIPAPMSNGTFFFGQSKNIDGLIVSIGPPDYDSGCSGTLDFEVALFNKTDSPIVLSSGLVDIKLFGNGEKQLSLYGDYGAATPRCYGNSFNIETLAPGSTAKFAMRTTDSLGGYEYLELVFGEATGRLAGEKWRLDLSAPFDISRTPYGQTINVDGLEITVGDENYFPSCNGTLGFQIALTNTTSQPIILSMNSSALALYGNNDSSLSIFSQLGSQSSNCYGNFNLETIQAGDTILIAVRNTSSLSGLSYVDLVFETNNRLDGLRWRLTLPR
jgi:hypothetical protein